MNRFFILLFFTCFLFAGIFADNNRSIPPDTENLPEEGSRGRGLEVFPLTGPTNIDDLISTLLGSSVSVYNVQYTGAEIASGLFEGGISSGIGIDEGVILSCGHAANAIGPNTSTGASAENYLPGDPDLDLLLPVYNTNDASILEFDFVPQFNAINFSYVFASEEYPEWVGSSFNDVFGFFLDGVNVALIPDTDVPVSINNVNQDSYSQYYINNHELYPNAVYDIQCDGFTTVLEVIAYVTPGTQHHIKLGIADTDDWSLDSWVFLEAESFSSVEIEEQFNVTVENFPDPGLYTNEDEFLDIFVTVTGYNNSVFQWLITLQPYNGEAYFLEPRQIESTRIIRYVPDPNVSNTLDDFTFTVSDGLGHSETIWLGVWVNAINDPPVNDIPPTISGEPYVGNTLTCDPGEWNDDIDNEWVDPEFYSTIQIFYQWQRQENRPNEWNDIEGETLPNYTLQMSDLNLQVRCMVTAQDDGIGNWPESTSLPTAPVLCIPLSDNEGNLVSAKPYLSVCPNPFNPSTEISYQIAENGWVKISIYNIKGEVIKTLVDEVKISGQHSIIWDGRNQQEIRCSSGLYFCNLQTDNTNLIEKIVLLK